MIGRLSTKQSNDDDVIVDIEQYQQQFHFFNLLPEDLQLYTLTFLPESEVFSRLSVVSQSFHQLCDKFLFSYHPTQNQWRGTFFSDRREHYIKQKATLMQQQPKLQITKDPKDQKNDHSTISLMLGISILLIGGAITGIILLADDAKTNKFPVILILCCLALTAACVCFLGGIMFAKNSYRRGQIMEQITEIDGKLEVNAAHETRHDTLMKKFG